MQTNQIRKKKEKTHEKYWWRARHNLVCVIIARCLNTETEATFQPKSPLKLCHYVCEVRDKSVFYIKYQVEEAENLIVLVNIREVDNKIESK